VGKTVLVVAHRDALRGLIQNFEQHSDPQGLSLPKGVPLVYKFDHEMRLVDIPKANQGTALFSDSSGFFLGDPKKLKARILEQQVELGLDAIPSQKRVARLVDALSKLRIEADLARGIAGRRVALSGNNTQSFDKWTDDPCEFEDYDVFSVEESESIQPSIITLADKQKKEDRTNDKMDGAVVVLIRHGRTPHNNFGLFTGWQDPPLADGGVDDARNAGRLLKQHSFEFDVVYTSWLTRAIQTAYYVLDELDCTWIPMVKSWRLNERMYGDLTGKSKKMIAHQFGDAQLRKWRRGYTVRPPAISSYSTEYPGNDVRRAKHFQDLPISWRETINRSIEQRRLVLHRKFPKTESLKDCMDRSIPFYTDRILTQAVQSGKRVLICSHENAIRGILKHLCSIPEEAMNQLHLPNGLPLIYNVKSECTSMTRERQLLLSKQGTLVRQVSHSFYSYRQMHHSLG
jgi:2,3-bisphosphoglycerate-dependent phosphoglycerate mutase